MIKNAMKCNLYFKSVYQLNDNNNNNDDNDNDNNNNDK